MKIGKIITIPFMNKKSICFGIAAIAILVVAITVYYGIQKHEEKEINYLINALKSEDMHVRELGMAEIPKYKNKAVTCLVRLLTENQNEEIQMDIIKSLGMIKSEKSASAILLFFKRTHKMPNEVTYALVRIGSPAVKPLFEAFDSGDDFTRAVVLGALNELKGYLLEDERTIENIKKIFLRAFLHDNSILVRKTALLLLCPFQDNIRTLLRTVLIN
jgi:hypothetical protein